MFKRMFIPLVALTLTLAAGSAALAQHRDMVFLGESHVDGRTDHDKIKVTAAEGRFRAIQLRVSGGGVDFDHVVVHYGNGSNEEIPVRDHIPSGGETRVIELPGERRVIQSVELWYGKRNANTRPTVQLFGLP
ncbi:MAG TPA: hypothetical protein VLV88_08035 [Terriglobales bacterium]|nr:hypothetical protein [Terriglobales bacterium]